MSSSEEKHAAGSDIFDAETVKKFGHLTVEEYITQQCEFQVRGNPLAWEPTLTRCVTGAL